MTKILSILSIVALCFVCLCTTCGAYWVDTGERDTLWVPAPDVFMLRYGTGSNWVSFANAPVASNSGTVDGIVVDDRAYQTVSQRTNTHCVSAIYTDSPADRAFIDYPTLRLSANDNPDLNLCYSYLQCNDTDIKSHSMTYEISYKIRWLSLETEYTDQDGNPVEPSGASAVDNTLVGKTYSGKYSKNQTLRAHQLDGRFVQYSQNQVYATVYLNIPNITTLMQVDSGLRDSISANSAVGDKFDVDYTVTAILNDSPIFQVGSIAQKPVNGGYDAYARYDATRFSLAENFTVKTRNPATLFNFITDTFTAVMEINIAGIKLGDILGIGVALSVLLMLLKVFAGG